MNSQTTKEMNRYHYQKGLVYCQACDKFLSLEFQAEEIETPNTEKGHYNYYYHKKRYCEGRSTSYRLRLMSRSRKARTIRQEAAVRY